MKTRGFLAIVIVALCLCARVAGQTTEFTHQGSLTISGTPANGNFDFEFKLFDAASAGAQVGSTVQRLNVAVAGGIYTVTLDFGPTAVSGADRFLDIAVRSAGGGAFTPLTPRQKITSAPYAIKSLNAGNASTADALSPACSGCVTAAQIGSVNGSAVAGTIPVAGVPAGSGNYIQNTATLQPSSTFNISGNGLVGGRIGVGTTTPASLLDVVNGTGDNRSLAVTRIGGNFNLIDFRLANGTPAAPTATTSGNGLFVIGGQGHDGAAFTGTQAAIRAVAAENWTPTARGAFLTFQTTPISSGLFTFERMRIDHNGNIGIATPNPVSKLHIADNGGNMLFGGGTCSSGFNGIGFATSLTCTNYSLLGNGTDTMINRPTGGTLHFRENNVTQMSIAAGGAVTATGTLTAGTVNTTSQYNINGNRAFDSTLDMLFAGLNAGPPSPSGIEDVFVGALSGSGSTSASFGTFVGYHAGFANSSGNGNTFIGAQTDAVSGTLTNATAIGYQARVDQSNSLVLGSVQGFNGAANDTNVGIGTTTPANTLHVRTNGGDILFGGGGCASGQVAIGFNTPMTGCTNYAIRDNGVGTLLINRPTGGAIHFRENNGTQMFIATGGDVGIGTTSPADKLDVNGDIRVGTSGTNGCLNNNNGGAIIGTCSSDLRFKKGVTPFTHTLSQIARLRPVYYYWRADEFPQKHFGPALNYGLVAQDVEQVLPELVSVDAQGYKQVDYSKLPLLTLEAVKELKDNADALRATNLQLQKQVDELKALICHDHPKARVCKEAKP